MPMRILQIATSVAASRGGPSTATLGLKRSLDRADETHEGTLWATEAYLDSDDSVLRSEDGIEFFPTSGPSTLEFSWRMLVKTFRDLRASEYDFVIMHGVLLLQTILTEVVCRILRVPHGIQVHGALEPYQMGKSRLKKRLFLPIVRAALENASFVACASTSEVEGVLVVAPRARCVVTGIGTDLRPEGAYLKKPRVVREDRGNFHIGYLGRIAPKKRLDIFCSAVARASQQTTIPTAVTVAGCAGEEERDLIESLFAREVHELTNIEVMGQISGADKESFWNRIDVFLLPSDNENFAIVVIEALTHGVLVVATPYVAAAQEAGKADAAVLCTQDPDEIAQLIVHLSHDSEKCEELREAGYSFVRDNYSWRAVSNVWIDTIDSAVTGRKSKTKC